MLTAKLGHRNPALSLAQNRKDLRLTVFRQLHQNLLVNTAEKILLTHPLIFRGDYPPSASVFCLMNWSVCFNVSGLGASTRPRWRSAHSDPHKLPGDKAAIFGVRFS